MRLLVAEDDRWIRDFLIRVLTSAGHDTAGVARGDDALTELRSDLYDIAILDVQMPMMNAIEVASACRPLGLHTALIILTADASTRTELDCLDLGVKQVLTKPVSTKQLLDAVTDSIAGLPDNTAAPVLPSLADRSTLDPHRASDLLRVYGGETGMRTALTNFAAHIVIAVDQIEQALAEGRPEEVRRYAHRIAGGAGTVGAVMLEQLGAKLSTSEDSTETAALVCQLKEAIGQFNRQIWSGQ